MKDKFMIGSLAGFTGSVAMAAVYYAFNALPGINAKVPYGPSLFFVPTALTGTYQGNFVGALTSLVCVPFSAYCL